jgi:hypothetical protein
MPDLIARLWRGDVGLARAFWEFGLLYGSLIHAIATGLALAAIVAGLPAWLAVTIFLLPAPYTVLAVVAVWRSADRYRGPPARAQLARIAIVIWALLATVV